MSVYLDNAATSWPKPEAVYQAVDNFMRRIGATPGRGGH
ncbi:MAG: cysteine desulfurase, partial [Anaerolineae bacterium]